MAVLYETPENVWSWRQESGLRVAFTHIRRIIRPLRRDTGDKGARKKKQKRTRSVFVVVYKTLGGAQQNCPSDLHTMRNNNNNNIYDE